MVQNYLNIDMLIIDNNNKMEKKFMKHFRKTKPTIVTI